ncbi:MAG: thiamine pyrophosphate-dependent dehydrogenase E1 component subunit alpha [Verrucomicrobiae bacterium]|nr:thiamine pyrophosphate-dependent dehydrogenase E1 component subunit alpha [Verrucomicrobiae bacterium]
MVETQATRDVVGEQEAEGLAQAFRWMLLARALDEKMANLYRGGRIHGGVFLGRGQEALSVAVGMNLRRGDIFAPLIRDLAGRLAFGEPVLDAVRTHLGSVLGPMRGRDGNIHRGRLEMGLYPMISHLGAMISVVNGALMARRMQGRSGTVGATCIGDGGTSTGAFHEAVNQAAVERLPLVLVIADNQYAYSTPTSRQYACARLLDRAAGYGVEGHAVDGTDLGACLATLREAVGRARAGRGPQMVVATLLRLCGHGEHDDASYVNPKLKELPVGRDCLGVAEQQVLERGRVTPAEVQRWRQEAQQQVEAAVAQVQQEPVPDPVTERWEAISTTRLLDQFAST